MDEQINNNSDYKIEALKIAKANLKRSFPFFIAIVIASILFVAFIEHLYF